MPDALVTTTELAVFNDWPADTYPQDRALQMIWAATAMVQAATGQRFVFVAGDVVVGYASDPSFYLPERPVTALTSVAITGGATYSSDSAWTLVGDKLTLKYWYGWPGELTITYSHGYATVPEQIKWVCLSAATRLLDNPGALFSASGGGESAVFPGARSGGEMGPGLLPSEVAALQPWRELLVH